MVRRCMPLMKGLVNPGRLLGVACFPERCGTVSIQPWKLQLIIMRVVDLPMSHVFRHGTIVLLGRASKSYSGVVGLSGIWCSDGNVFLGLPVWQIS